MSITIYGINNCDTCRKARRWLKEQAIEHQWHDIRKDGLDADMVEDWSKAIGVETLINRRGQSWRKLDDSTRAQLNEGHIPSFLEHPTVIKRPVMTKGQTVSVGFKPDDWAEAMR